MTYRIMYQQGNDPPALWESDLSLEDVTLELASARDEYEGEFWTEEEAVGAVGCAACCAPTEHPTP